jgi:hypothetical protein
VFPERERETKKDTERQKDRKTERERETKRDTETQRDRKTERQRERLEFLTLTYR